MGVDAEPFGAVKSFAETIQAFLTSAAIIVGGLWALYRYRRFSESSRCLATSHTIELIKVSNGLRVLRLKVHVRNVGKVRLIVNEANFRIYRLEPVTPDVVQTRTANGHEVKWPLIEKRLLAKDAHFKLEPGETWTVPVDFVLPSDLKKVLCFSFVTDERKPTWRQRLSAWKARFHADHVASMADGSPELVAEAEALALKKEAALKQVRAVGWHAESIFELNKSSSTTEEETSRAQGGVHGNEERDSRQGRGEKEYEGSLQEDIPNREESGSEVDA